MSEGGFLDKMKDALGGAVGDVSDKAKDLAEGTAEKIDAATDASGGVVKQAGDMIGSGKEKIGDAAADLADKLTGGGGGGAG
jgi:methyl-accepting chemotaxis protein